MNESMIQDRILKLEKVDWRNIQPLQPDNIKHVFNYQYIEDSIRKNGFAFPFGVWECDGVIYAVDGHTRKEVLSNMEGVPDLLPAFFIDAKDRKEAVKILLDVFNQRQNPVDQEVLLQWLEVEEIKVEEVAVESLSIKKEVDIPDYSDRNEEIDTDSFDDKMSLKLDYTEDEYRMVREGLAKIAATPEQAVWQLLGYE